MIQFKNRNWPLLHILTLLLGISYGVSGQIRQQYMGPMTLGKYHGEADYSYLLMDRDTILDGPFSIKRSNLEALLEKEDFSFNITGVYSKGYPQGSWQFQFGEFQSNSESRVVGYQYRVLISGEQEAAKGALDLGKPDGSWTL
ncbi:MAG: hypothetical protein AAGA86_08845, partial [Bacteroidota bacterium]